MNRCITDLRSSLACVAIMFGSSFVGDQLYAQSGLRESLERLDKNENGMIDPEEITPLARPYLEQLARVRSKQHRLSLDRPIAIDKLQEAARNYYAARNGVNDRGVRPEGESTIKPFGPDPDRPLIPEFGLAEIRFPYTQDDLDFADRTMSSHDRNGDGYIDRAEAARNRWTHRSPFDDDLNKDNRLSRLEMAQRYARRRLLEGASDELRRKAWRTGGDVRPSTKEQQRRDSSQWWRRGGSGTWLTASVMSRFDLNRNGRLEFSEAQSIGIPSGRIDRDRDGDLSRDELHAFLTEMQDEAGDPMVELPSWFYELDVDRDGQVAMHEFATNWSMARLQEFTSLDRNDDGLLTSSEVIQSKAMVGGSYRNQNAEVLPPRKTIISEIEISEDYLIGDLNVQLSITHSNTSFLDAYLTGPDGQRIELFTDVGSSGDNFDQTLFDDQSRFPITKAKTPFKGTFYPEAMIKRQPSLSHFNGKSVKGVWQLVVRGARSERFGMLHGWGLIVKPHDNLLGGTAAAPSQDGPQPRAIPSARSQQDRRSDSSNFGSTSRESPQRRGRDQNDNDKNYQEAIRGRIRAAVAAGKLTKEDAEKKMSSLGEQLRKKRLSPEASEKYKRLLENKQGKESKRRKKLPDGKDPSQGKRFPDGKGIRRKK